MVNVEDAASLKEQATSLAEPRGGGSYRRRRLSAAEEASPPRAPVPAPPRSLPRTRLRGPQALDAEVSAELERLGADGAHTAGDDDDDFAAQIEAECVPCLARGPKGAPPDDHPRRDQARARAATRVPTLLPDFLQ